MNQDVKKYAPGVVIALVVVFAISRLRGSARAPIVSNALLPSAPGTPPESRDPARVAAFGRLADIAIGGQAADVSKAGLSTQLELGKFRLQEQSTIAQASQSLALELEKLRQSGMSERLMAELADRNFDRELQRRAIDQTAALAQAGQIGQGVSDLLGQILGALRPRPGSGAGSRSGGGSGGGSGGSFPLPRRSTRRPVRLPSGAQYDPNYVGLSLYDPGSYSPLPYYNDVPPPPDFFDWSDWFTPSFYDPGSYSPLPYYSDVPPSPYYGGAGDLTGIFYEDYWGNFGSDGDWVGGGGGSYGSNDRYFDEFFAQWE